jgi:WD40 repeat protein
VRLAAFSSDGKSIVSPSSDATVRVWNVSTEKQVHELKKHTHYVRSAAFSSRSSALPVRRRCVCGTPALESRCASSRNTQLRCTRRRS